MRERAYRSRGDRRPAARRDESWVAEKEERGGGRSLLGWGLLLAAGAAVAVEWPAIQRYLKMRSM